MPPSAFSSTKAPSPTKSPKPKPREYGECDKKQKQKPNKKTAAHLNGPLFSFLKN
jgi:hypothetical protein